MSASRYPCLECAEPFDSVEERLAHWREFGHGPEQVQLDAVDRARYGVMGDDAPAPESAYGGVVDRTLTTRRRIRMRLIQGGRL